MTNLNISSVTFFKQTFYLRIIYIYKNIAECAEVPYIPEPVCCVNILHYHNTVIKTKQPVLVYYY